MRKLHTVSFILLVVGGLDWLLVGVGGFDWNIVEILGSSLARIVYLLVGLSAVNEIIIHRNICKKCDKAAPVSTVQA